MTDEPQPRNSAGQEATGIPTWLRFAFAVVLTVVGGVLIGEGLPGSGTYDDGDPVPLILGLVASMGAFYNLIVGAVTRGLLDAE